MSGRELSCNCVGSDGSDGSEATDHSSSHQISAFYCCSPSPAITLLIPYNEINRLNPTKGHDIRDECFVGLIVLVTNSANHILFQ